MTTAAVLWHENYNLDEIVTPVNVVKFAELLRDTEYNKIKTDFLVDGFSKGFSLRFAGNRKVIRTAPNLKIRIGSKTELWNKVMKEVEAKRYAGPYTEVPYQYFIQSPIGLVPKDKGTKTRLIFHLSYPRVSKDGECSVNAGIPKEYCTVKYPDFAEAVQLCRKLGVSNEGPVFCGKSDMSMAFRQAPIRIEDFCLLILKATHPITGVTYYFCDKALPFGSSISCAIFQEISNGIAHIFMVKTAKKTVNYLDDFFFAAILKTLCDHQVNCFINVCKTINFPLSLEKTEWGNTMITFLGFLLDTERELVCIPVDKVVRALDMIEYFINRRKVTVHEIQKLAGFLNFLCRCIVPGRAFTRRLYALMAGHNSKLKPHHHVRVKSENKLDLGLWKQFLTSPTVFSRSFRDFELGDAEPIQFYSDASGNFHYGYGAWCYGNWLQSHWNVEFMRRFRPSIEFLELYAVAVAVMAWIHMFANRKIFIFCDNESVCRMIDNSSSTCQFCMILIRIIILKSMTHNVRIFAKHVKTDDNGIADALSRFQMKRFRKLAPWLNNVKMTEIPEEISPISKIWPIKF